MFWEGRGHEASGADVFGGELPGTDCRDPEVGPPRFFPGTPAPTPG